MTETLYYLAYGSNLFTQRMVDRVPSATPVGTTVIDGYKLCFDVHGVDISAKANIRKTNDQRDAVYAVVYAINADEKPLLDAVEGDQYAVHDITVTTAAHQTIDAFVYIGVNEHITTTQKPYTWYRELISEGARSHDFPEFYCQEIAKIEAIEDTDKARDAANRYGVL